MKIIIDKEKPKEICSIDTQSRDMDDEDKIMKKSRDEVSYKGPYANTFLGGGAGAVVGFVVGGPLGAAAGAAVGGFLGALSEKDKQK